MSTRRDRARALFRERCYLFARYALALVVILVCASLRCGGPGRDISPGVSPVAAEEKSPGLATAAPPAGTGSDYLTAPLWADSSGGIDTGSENENSTVSSLVSLDVRDANILDILSILAVKLDSPIVLLEAPRTVTFKVNNLAPLSAFQLLLQKEGLDYVTVGGNFLVGERERLQKDFFNLMILTRFNLDYISAKTLRGLIDELGIPLQSITVDANPQAIWVQGTTVSLGKIRELIDAVDRPENANPEEGGHQIFIYYLNNTVAADVAERLSLFEFSGVRTVVLNHSEFTRQILVITPASLEAKVRATLRELDSAQQKFRFPVASGSSVAILNEQLVLLQDLITHQYTASKLPGAAPRVDPNELFWKISGNIGTLEEPRFILWVEGTPDNIELIRNMVVEIKDIQSLY